MGLVAPGEVEQWLAEQPRGGIVCRTPGIWMLEVNLKSCATAIPEVPQF